MDDAAAADAAAATADCVAICPTITAAKIVSVDSFLSSSDISAPMLDNAVNT